MSINAYAYCLNNPIKYSDPTGKTPQGVAVAEIISTILICYDAFLRAGKNFAYIVATEIINNKNVLYQPGENEKERASNAKKWYDDLFDNFIEFTETFFYKLTSIIAPELFLNFFKESAKEQIEYYSMTISNVITITFGLGDGESFFSTLADAVNGRIQTLASGNLSTGVIIKDTSVGTYLQSVVDNLNGFFGCISLDIEFEIIHFPPIDSGYAVNTEHLPYAVLIYFIGIILSAFNAGDLQRA